MLRNKVIHFKLPITVRTYRALGYIPIAIFLLVFFVEDLSFLPNLPYFEIIIAVVVTNSIFFGMTHFEFWNVWLKCSRCKEDVNIYFTYEYSGRNRYPKVRYECHQCGKRR